MEQATALFNAIYSRFILRDLFGKIVPGIAILTSLVLFFNYPVNFSQINQLSFWIWLIYFGFSWFMGFVIQSIGEFFLGNFKYGYRYFPKWIMINNKKTELTSVMWNEMYLGKFQEEGVDKETVIRIDERFVIIKEACGNGFVASFIILVLYWIKLGTISFNAQSIILIIILLALWRMHIKHVNRQFQHIEYVLNSRKQN